MGVALYGIEQVGEYWTIGHSADIVCRYALSPFCQVLQLCISLILGTYLVLFGVFSLTEYFTMKKLTEL